MFTTYQLVDFAFRVAIHSSTRDVSPRLSDAKSVAVKRHVEHKGSGRVRQDSTVKGPFQRCLDFIKKFTIYHQSLDYGDKP
jgi:hypothetical protein